MIVELPRAAAQPPRRAMSSRLDSSQEDMGAYSSGDDAPSLGHSPNTSAKIEAGRQRVRATFLHALKGKCESPGTKSHSSFAERKPQVLLRGLAGASTPAVTACGWLSTILTQIGATLVVQVALGHHRFFGRLHNDVLVLRRPPLHECQACHDLTR